MSDGHYVNTRSFCKWCGGEIRVWVSDWDESGELPEADYCCIMCQLEEINFQIMHR